MERREAAAQSPDQRLGKQRNEFFDHTETVIIDKPKQP